MENSLRQFRYSGRDESHLPRAADGLSSEGELSTRCFPITPERNRRVAASLRGALSATRIGRSFRFISQTSDTEISEDDWNCDEREWGGASGYAYGSSSEVSGRASAVASGCSAGRGRGVGDSACYSGVQFTCNGVRCPGTGVRAGRVRGSGFGVRGPRLLLQMQKHAF